MKNLKTIELLILGFTFFLILLSEYYYLFENKFEKAVFLGLWPPTIIALLIYITIKNRK